MNAPVSSACMFCAQTIDAGSLERRDHGVERGVRDAQADVGGALAAGSGSSASSRLQ